MNTKEIASQIANAVFDMAASEPDRRIVKDRIEAMVIGVLEKAIVHTLKADQLPSHTSSVMPLPYKDVSPEMLLLFNELARKNAEKLSVR